MYPYPRFLKIDLPPLSRLRVFLSVRRRRFMQALRPLWWRWFGERRYLRNEYPLLPADAEPPLKWRLADGAHTSLGGSAGWRTTHGKATVYWSRQLDNEPEVERVVGAAYPDGRRGEVIRSIAGLRRRALPPRLWTYGRVEISDGDALFLDHATQPAYTAPGPDSSVHLEYELAGCRDFVAALQDDDFAKVAFAQLAHQDWLNFRDPGRNGAMSLDDVSDMIAGLRDKGENYLDYKFGDGWEKVSRASRAENGRRLHSMLHGLGWKTHSQEDLRAIARADLLERLADRVDLLRFVRRMEDRPERWCEPFRSIERPLALPLAIYEGDETAWIPDSADEQEALLGDLSLRFLSLVNTGRITREEYDAMKRKLGRLPLDFP